MTEPTDPALAVFHGLRTLTPARIGLGRVGRSLPTAPMLSFQLAHAKARDAVRASLDIGRLRGDLPLESIVLDSAAPDRETYLRRPDLGRRLAAQAVGTGGGEVDVALVVADGLSAMAAQRHGPGVVRALVPRLAGLRLAPVVIVRQGRVAVGDEVGALFRARVVVVLIGERPGLSAADSLGAYITWDPRPGRLDSERNCISNIHGGGLSPEDAAARIGWLVGEARRLGLTGVALKDRAPATAPAALPR